MKFFTYCIFFCFVLNVYFSTYTISYFLFSLLSSHFHFIIQKPSQNNESKSTTLNTLNLNVYLDTVKAEREQMFKAELDERDVVVFTGNPSLGYPLELSIQSFSWLNPRFLKVTSCYIVLGPQVPPPGHVQHRYLNIVSRIKFCLSTQCLLIYSRKCNPN